VVLSTYDFQKKYCIKGADKVVSIAFADKKLVLPLQAADLVAYESAKWAKNSSPGVGLPMRRSLEELLRSVRYNTFLFDSGQYDEMMKIMRAPPSAGRDGSLVKLFKESPPPWLPRVESSASPTEQSESG
jgi:hypothetical protein